MARHQTTIHRILSGFVAVSFLLNSVVPGYAQGLPQTVLNLPVPGTMVTQSAAFSPALVTGMTLYPDDPLRFEFIIDIGDDKLQGEALERESQKLIHYFMAALTVPEDELWVNLSPYEKDRIIPSGLSQTEMGRDMLAQDYLLKQLTASLMYPEDEFGKEFWKRVYAKAQAQFGTTEIPVNTFNKVWIVPEQAVVYVHGNSVFVAESHLKVMLEEDYEALQNKMSNAESRAPREGSEGARDQAPTQLKSLVSGSQARETRLGAERLSLPLGARRDDFNSPVVAKIVREILLPAIEVEVNAGKNFANLRQIYHSMILAAWYKKHLQEGLLGKIYLSRNKTSGIALGDKEIKDKIYAQYLDAFKRGVYNYIKEDYDPATRETIPRKYFSGGLKGVAQVTEERQVPAALAARTDRPHATVVVQAENVQVGEEDTSDQESSSPVQLNDLINKLHVKIGDGPVVPVYQTFKEIIDWQDLHGTESTQELVDRIKETFFTAVLIEFNFTIGYPSSDKAVRAAWKILNDMAEWQKEFGTNETQVTTDHAKQRFFEVMSDKIQRGIGRGASLQTTQEILRDMTRWHEELGGTKETQVTTDRAKQRFFQVVLDKIQSSIDRAASLPATQKILTDMTKWHEELGGTEATKEIMDEARLLVQGRVPLYKGKKTQPLEQAAIKLRDYYEILRVSESASQQEIEVAWKIRKKEITQQTVQKIITEEVAEAETNSLVEAYFTLSDPARRTKYDQTRQSSSPIEIDKLVNKLRQELDWRRPAAEKTFADILNWQTNHGNPSTQAKVDKAKDYYAGTYLVWIKDDLKYGWRSVAEKTFADMLKWQHDYGNPSTQAKVEQARFLFGWDSLPESLRNAPAAEDYELKKLELRALFSDIPTVAEIEAALNADLATIREQVAGNELSATAVESRINELSDISASLKAKAKGGLSSSPVQTAQTDPAAGLQSLLNQMIGEFAAGLWSEGEATFIRILAWQQSQGTQETIGIVTEATGDVQEGLFRKMTAELNQQGSTVAKGTLLKMLTLYRSYRSPKAQRVINAAKEKFMERLLRELKVALSQRKRHAAKAIFREMITWQYSFGPTERTRSLVGEGQREINRDFLARSGVSGSYNLASGNGQGSSPVGPGEGDGRASSPVKNWASLETEFTILIEAATTQDELKRIYRRMAKEVHPDKNPGEEENAEAVFKQLADILEKKLERVFHVKPEPSKATNAQDRRRQGDEWLKAWSYGAYSWTADARAVEAREALEMRAEIVKNRGEKNISLVTTLIAGNIKNLSLHDLSNLLDITSRPEFTRQLFGLTAKGAIVPQAVTDEMIWQARPMIEKMYSLRTLQKGEIVHFRRGSIIVRTVILEPITERNLTLKMVTPKEAEYQVLNITQEQLIGPDFDLEREPLEQGFPINIGEIFDVDLPHYDGFPGLTTLLTITGVDRGRFAMVVQDVIDDRVKHQLGPGASVDINYAVAQLRAGKWRKITPQVLIPDEQSVKALDPSRDSQKKPLEGSSPVTAGENSAANSPDYGGIDFNPENLQLKEEGGKVEFDPSVFDAPGFDPNSVQGLRPVIIHITPVTNFPLLLGLSSPADTIAYK